MIIEKKVRISRTEIKQLIEKEYKIKIIDFSLSSKGLRGNIK